MFRTLLVLAFLLSFAACQSVDVVAADDSAVAGSTLMPSGFDTTCVNIPPGFSGTDLRGLFMLALNESGIKHDLETLVQFRKRIAELPDDRTLYAIPVELDRFISISYGRSLLMSSEKVLTLKNRIECCVFNPAASRVTGVPGAVEALLYPLIVARDIVDESHGLGTNAFGVSFEVSVVNGEEFGLMFEQWSGAMGWRLEVPMDLSAAMDVEGSADRVLLIFDRRRSGALPSAFVGIDEAKATIDAPVAYSFDVNVITCSLIDVWLYESASGRVLVKHRVRE